MKSKALRPLFWLISLLVIASLACNIGGSATTEPPPATQEPVVSVPTAEPTVASVPTEIPTVESGAVKDLDSVKSAVVQIVAEGSFLDPGQWNINVGSSGTGFIIDPSGIAVTNNHVVTGAAFFKVYVGGDLNKAYDAKVLGISECSDLAIIDIEGDGFPFLDWYTDEVKVGLDIYAAGFPFGDPEYTLTQGIVSKAQTGGDTVWASVKQVIQHTAKINPGNSGGPLVTKDGKVVAVNYAGITEMSDQNFAIARDAALPVLEQLQDGKDVDAIGVNGITLAGVLGSSDVAGVWVRSVASGSPADKARIQAGDIIYQMEGQVLATDGTMREYCNVLRSHDPTDTLSVSVIRSGDMSYMEGQLNGRELEFMGYLDDSSSSTTSSGGGELTGPDATDYPEYVVVTDDSGQVRVEVPVEWADLDGSVWQSDWGTIQFDAPQISAAYNLDAFFDTSSVGYTESGVFFAASPDMGKIGGYVQLLDGVKGWNEDNCDYSGRTKYGEGDWYDPLYEGQFDFWENCGSFNTAVFTLAARPKADPFAYLVLLEVHITKEADWAALQRILASFEADY
ncbi:MAG: S1C family serine protease [Anaerolineales bacterium]|nr:S1C family serine protease [Anaerolineales bacterium]